MKFKEQEITSQNEYQLEFKKFVEKILMLNNNQKFDLNHYVYMKRNMNFWENAPLGKSIKKEMAIFNKYFSLEEKEREKIKANSHDFIYILIEIYLFLFSYLPIQIHTLILNHQLVDFYFESDIAESDNDLILILKCSLKNKKQEVIDIDRVFFIEIKEKSSHWSIINCDCWIKQIDSILKELFEKIQEEVV